MDWIVSYLWLIPFLPFLAAGALALTPRPYRSLAAGMAVGAMLLAFLFSAAAFLSTLGPGAGDEIHRQYVNFDWLQMGETVLRLGWVLDPLTALMLLMVTFVGLLIFIYSIGYMAHDPNFTRFFCFLSLFAGAMLGLVMANNLLLLFMCWELVGLASYLLIGFWYVKPEAQAAAKKAFITTRIGDLGFFLGLIWLYSETGTLLLYDQGNGVLEASALSALVAKTVLGGVGVSTLIALLLFVGAIGKSGQVPLHVWLPDAMEGPTPVSALIHAATMVAAGVFLVARMYPLFEVDPTGSPGLSPALTVVTWVGTITAVFAALIAVAQNDIKRILAYSTVSQLGYMMMGIGVAGVATGMFLLITHAFFKALLFLGAGSVIHGMQGEQDIRRMGGGRRFMPITFATYAIGTMAIAGVPIFFSGFWSKEGILHGAHVWAVSPWPFYLAIFGAFLTALYMTRQVCYIFLGEWRNPAGDRHKPHESPSIMVGPLIILAAFSILLGFLGTPVWPWFQDYLTGRPATLGMAKLFQWDVLMVMLISSAIAIGGIGAGWWFYGRTPPRKADEADPLETPWPEGHRVLREKFFVDELYDLSVVRFHSWWAWFGDWLDRTFWRGINQALSLMVLGLSWLSRLFDEYVINLGFDLVCQRLRAWGSAMLRAQTGRAHDYLRVLGIGAILLLLVMLWGCGQ
jgi:NADH-quinone oxidoreductase subunit L